MYCWYISYKPNEESAILRLSVKNGEGIKNALKMH
jgi:hypothetical protein